MGAGVVTVGRQRYAVGLYWENSPGSGRVAQIAKEAASQPGQQADYYAVRPGNKDGRIPQFGLTTKEAGQKAGMPVLAGCLASQIPGSWAGAFRLNEGIIVVIVRDDLIVPDGDLYFLDENEARDRLIQEVGFGGLQTVFAPDSWSIPSADTIPLTLLLSDRRDIKLQPVLIPKKVKIAAAAIAGIFLLLLGGMWWWQEKVDEENALRAEHEAALQRAQEAAKRLLPSGMQQEAPPEAKYDRKWENAPPPLEYIEACRQGLAQIPAAVAGWNLSALRCSGSAMTLSWGRQKGISAPPPGTILNDNATTATQTIALTGLHPRGAEALVDSDVVTNLYLAKNWPGTVNRVGDDPLPAAPPGYSGNWNPPPPPWVKRSFTLAVSELPADIPDLIDDLPGVIINSMNYSPGSTAGAWTVEGVIYENRK